MKVISTSLIEKARSQIATYVRKTPLIPFDHAGKSVLLKCEMLQKTGSFKLRGATNCILENLTKAKTAGVIAASAGNHAQGVAAISHQLGIRATILMPVVTPTIKVQHTARWGAQVKLVGEIYDDSYDEAVKISKAEGQIFVHPFLDPNIIAGQGTIAMELLEETAFSDCEAVVVSIGGGGLISGIASYLKEKKPSLKIYGVTASNAPSLYQSYKKKTLVEEPVTFTLAEGVAAKRTEPEMLQLITPLVDNIFSISEERIAHAIAVVAEKAKLVVEGAGALPMAALIDGLIPEKKITLILSGGNIDLPALSHVLERGLVEQGRLIRLVITVSDRPGGLHSITGVLAEAQANILQVVHQRTSLNTPFGQTEVELDLETKGPEHSNQIVTALSNRGFRVERVK